jgi:hypothetical protein
VRTHELKLEVTRSIWRETGAPEQLSSASREFDPELLHSTGGGAARAGAAGRRGRALAPVRTAEGGEVP